MFLVSIGNNSYDYDLASMAERILYYDDDSKGKYADK